MKRIPAPTKIAFGLLIGQGTLYLSTPLLSRLYSPAEMGEFTLFITLTSLTAVIGTLRVEQFIPASSQSTARNRSVIAATLACGFSALCAIIYGAAYSQSAFVVALFWLTATSLSLIAISIQLSARFENYNGVALGKALMGTAQAGTQVFAGFLRIASPGLLIGAAVGYALSAVVQISLLLRGQRKAPLTKGWRFRAVFAAFPRIRTLTPVFSSSLLNVAATSSLVIGITVYAGESETGELGIAQRLALLPAGLAVAALGPVIAGKVAADMRAGQDSKKTIKKWLRRLLIPGFLAGGILAAAPSLPLTELLGPEWDGVGPMLFALAPAAAMQIVAGPFSQVLIVRGQFNYQLIWEVLRAIAVVGSLVAAYYLGSEPHLFVLSGSVALAAAYIAQLVIVTRPQR